ncbi:MAG: hypothetical protein WBG43_06840 [Marinifilaceae bacterium]
MRKILLILFSIVLLVSCIKMEGLDSIPTVKMGDKEYLFNMPIMSSDVDEIKTYLAKVGASMTEEKDGDIVKIVADITSSTRDLFSRVEYTFKYNGDKNEFLNINLAYNNVIPDSYIKLHVTTYLSNSCMFDFK